jgi:hypothetical protein
VGLVLLHGSVWIVGVFWVGEVLGSTGGEVEDDAGVAFAQLGVSAPGPDVRMTGYEGALLGIQVVCGF